jgi:hypothetical protein
VSVYLPAGEPPRLYLEALSSSGAVPGLLAACEQLAAGELLAPVGLLARLITVGPPLLATQYLQVRLTSVCLSLCLL